MIRLTENHPFNSDPPLTLLMHHGFITPTPLHYVRNHSPVPKATWEDWTVEVTGLVKNPTEFTMDQLVSEFPTREFPVTLVCTSNRHKKQNFNWGAAGVSTSVWRGVPLWRVLRHCGIQDGALNVCFEGAEDSGGSKYRTNIKEEFAMDPSRDIILAYMQNGKRLSPDHGFPVRMILPGFIGGQMVKWLKRIIVTTEETDNYKDNRALPSHLDAKLADAKACWYEPEYIINELNINSVITTPCHEEMLSINSCTTETPYMLRGYAYSSGKKVTRVEVTMDGGEKWHLCKVDHQEKPNEYGKYWCWCFWDLEVEVLELTGGAKEIAVRAWDETLNTQPAEMTAWDETLNTQPEKLISNVMETVNNCWYRVRMNVCKSHKGEIQIIFEHPTQSGNQSGGSMAQERIREREKSSDLKQKHISTASSPFKTPCKLVDRTPICHNVRKLKFALPNDDQTLGIRVGNHVVLCATINDQECSREYTPTSSADQVGYFELVVKVYFKGVNPEFPNGGLMSQYLDSVPLGSNLLVKGPRGHIEYIGRGNFMVHSKHKFAKRLAMYARGNGITPIYQVIQAVLNDPDDDTEMYLVYTNKTEGDIVLREDLDLWSKNHEKRFKVQYELGESQGDGWRYSVRKISEIILEGIPNMLALACGQRGMIDSLKANLMTMGHDIEDSLVVWE